MLVDDLQANAILAYRLVTDTGQKKVPNNKFCFCAAEIQNMSGTWLLFL